MYSRGAASLGVQGLLYSRLLLEPLIQEKPTDCSVGFSVVYLFAGYSSMFVKMKP